MNRRKEEHDDTHDIIDLTSITNSSANDIRYVCKECKPEQLLFPYPKQSPFAGPSYRCPLCDTVYDSSLVKLPRAAKPVRSTIGSERDSLTDFIVDIVPENKGIEREDEYDKYNPEPNEEEWLKAQGVTIIESKIELTDSSGMNRTIVKSSKDESFRRLTQRQQS